MGTRSGSRLSGDCLPFRDSVVVVTRLGTGFRGAMSETIREIKLNKNKPDQEFRCTCLHREEGYLVISYVSSQDFHVDGITIEKGTATVAHYWNDRGYIVWKFVDPRRHVKGYLFHICRDVEIGESSVRYQDLIVDVWFHPDGTCRVLDEDELKDCLRRGLVDDSEAKWIERQKTLVVSDFRRIVGELWTEPG